MKQETFYSLMGIRNTKSLYELKLYWTHHWLKFLLSLDVYLPIFTFTSLVFIPIDIESSAVDLKIYSITACVKKYKSIIKKRRRKRDKIVLLAKQS